MNTNLTVFQRIAMGELLNKQETALRKIIDEYAILELELNRSKISTQSLCFRMFDFEAELKDFHIKQCHVKAQKYYLHYKALSEVLWCKSVICNILESWTNKNPFTESQRVSLLKLGGLLETALSIIIELKQANGIK
jgi:hypothetical protein